MFDEQPDGDPHGKCALEIARLNAENAKLRTVVQLYVDTIHWVENRCMAVDGPVTPTHKEITDDELRKVYVAATTALKRPPMTQPLQSEDATTKPVAMEQQHEDFPPLPEPFDTTGFTPGMLPVFTEHQMHAYLRADRASRPKVEARLLTKEELIAVRQSLPYGFPVQKLDDAIQRAVLEKNFPGIAVKGG